MAASRKGSEIVKIIKFNYKNEIFNFTSCKMLRNMLK